MLRKHFSCGWIVGKVLTLGTHNQDDGLLPPLDDCGGSFLREAAAEGSLGSKLRTLLGGWCKVMVAVLGCTKDRRNLAGCAVGELTLERHICCRSAVDSLFASVCLFVCFSL